MKPSIKIWLVYFKLNEVRLGLMKLDNVKLNGDLLS
jgi:hypothetical protein